MNQEHEQGEDESVAQNYTQVNATQHSAGLFLLDKLDIAPGMRVLDVGCGTGNLTVHIADLVGETGEVVGIDPSHERIRIAQREQEEQQEQTGKKGTERRNVSFHVGRAEDLSDFHVVDGAGGKEGGFDVVYVNSTFHWVEDQPAAMREFARVLKPRVGRLGMSGGSGDFVAVHEKIKADVLSREPYREYPVLRGPKFLKREEMEGLLDVAGGFSRREIVVNTIVKHAVDGAAMIDWLDTSSSGKTYGGIPLEMRPAAREEMKEEWKKVTTEDGIHMELELLVVVAFRD